MMEVGEWKTFEKSGFLIYFVTGCSIFNFKNASKIKPRKSSKKRCLPATNESTDTDFYLEEELETNNSNDLLPVTHSEKSLDRTISYDLKEKINFLEAESNAVKAENDNQMKDDYDDYYITMKTSLEIKSILKKLHV